MLVPCNIAVRGALHGSLEPIVASGLDASNAQSAENSRMEKCTAVSTAVPHVVGTAESSSTNEVAQGREARA